MSSALMKTTGNAVRRATEVSGSGTRCATALPRLIIGQDERGGLTREGDGV